MTGSSRSISFVAYSSHDEKLASMIFDAIQKTNSLAISIRYEPWVFNDTPGNIIINPIIDKIYRSTFIVADITYLNLNVVYEIGFAIGKKKKIFLIRNKDTAGHKDVSNKIGIFDTLGYFEYDDTQSLIDRLSSHISTDSIPVEASLDRKAPLYIVEPPTITADTTVVVSRIKKAGYRYRSFDPSEDVRLSANDAIRQVASSSGIVLLLQNEHTKGSFIQNVRCMFAAGLAHGMQKPVLILSPRGYDAPLDVRDFAKVYRNPDDIRDHIAEFCPKINSYLQEIDPPPAIKTGTLLHSLSMGDPTAENEMTTLETYYLQTDQYQRALRGEVNLVVGRKGSGKTALFIQVRDKTRSNKKNIVVDLKPEGYQLIKIKEDIMKHLSLGAQQHLITAFWEYILLLEVAYKILEKDQYIYRHDHELYELYINLEKLYRVENFVVEGDFSERLLFLSNIISKKYKEAPENYDREQFTNKTITELLHMHDIRELRKHISTYLRKKDSVWILFDNLDKGWSTNGVDVADMIILRCLIDAGRKIEREMRKDGHSFICMVFVRNDVYDHLMKNSPDYGKEMRAVMDWTDEDLLKEIIKLRLAASLDEDSHKFEFHHLWSLVCASHYMGEESSSYIIDRSLMRPRNVLKIFNHCRGFAVNFNRNTINEEDIEKGLKSYSQDLLIELDKEIGDVFPQNSNMLYYFVDCPPTIDHASLYDIIRGSGIDGDSMQNAIDFLLYYGVIGLKIGDQEIFIYHTNYDLKLLKIKAEKNSTGVLYVVNPAFWPALGIQRGRGPDAGEGALLL